MLHGSATAATITPYAQANLITDQNERARLYQQAQQAMSDDIPLIRLADVKAYVALRKNVQGFRPSSLGAQPYGGVYPGALTHRGDLSSRHLPKLHLPAGRGQRERLQHIAHRELIDRLEQDQQAGLVEQHLLIFQ